MDHAITRACRVVANGFSSIVKIMELRDIRFMHSVVGDRRRLFYYATDHYALQLLERALGGQIRSIADIRQSRWAKLLDRPILQQALGQWGDGQISAQRLALLRHPEPLSFRLSFNQWGAPKHRWNNYDQTSRPGYNLVLQLNFNGLHNKTYQQMVGPRNRHPFRYYGHPSLAKKDFTLAWVRIDLSEDYSEALIEEIQSDWWRAAKSEIYVRKHKKRDAQGRWQEWTEKKSRNQIDVAEMEQYLSDTLQPYGKLWPEAALSAALDFLLEEVQVDKVFYHEYKSGCLLKNCQPPRSLYTQLPKRFCFELTDQRPSFLEDHIQRNRKLRNADLKFWRLQ